MWPTVLLLMDFLVGGCIFVVLFQAWQCNLPGLYSLYKWSLTSFGFHAQAFSLPACQGGLGLPDPSLICTIEFAASHNICESLRNFISDRSLSFSEVSSSQFHRKFLICKSKAEEFSSLPSALRENFDQSLQCAMDFASVKVASSYFMPYPYKNLHKSVFLDALALRYGWMPFKVPSLCACWSSFSVDHVLSCPKGGLPSLCHNDIRDLTASF